MENNDYKFVAISDAVAIPVPKGLSSEDEAQFVADYLAQLKPDSLAALEAEYRDLLEQRKQGKLVSFESALQKLGVLQAQTKKQPA